jgi:DNA-binding response OmpR family regulator
MINKKKILLLEDDQTLCRLLTTLLEMENYNIAPFSEINPDELLSFLSSFSPDAIIMDINLKGMNGIDTLRTIRSNKIWGNNIKIIISSGENRKEESMNAGASYFLQKPFMPSELLNTLQNLITE